MAKIETLTDDFSAADNATWWFTGAVATVGGRLLITPDSTYPGIYSKSTFDLVDSYVQAEIAQAPNLGNGSNEVYLTLDVGPDKIELLISGSWLTCRETISGTNDEVAVRFDPIAHRWWRIRESGGVIFWETSSNGIRWQERRRKAYATAVPNSVYVGISSGYFGTEPAPGTTLVDNLNLPAPTRTASTFYVDPAGNDAASGTSPAAAWRSLDRVNSETLLPGDTVRLKGGTTFTGFLWLESAESGLPGQPITFESYGSAKATIQTALTDAVIIHDVGHVVVKDLVLVGDAWAFDNKSGVNCYNDLATQLHDVRIENVDVSNFKLGIGIGGATHGFSDLTVENATLHNNRDGGLVSYGVSFDPLAPAYAHSDIAVRNVIARNNAGNPANIWTNSGNGIVLGSVDTGLIEHCTAHDNGASCTAPEGPAGIWTFDSKRVTIQHCLAYRNRTGGPADGDGFDLDINVSHCVVQYNVAYANDGAGILVYTSRNNNSHANNVVRYNLCHDNARKKDWYGEIKIAGRIDELTVYNNTFLTSDQGPETPSVISIEGAVKNTTLRNNILYTSGTGPIVESDGDPGASVTLQGNTYWREAGFSLKWGASTYSSLDEWRIAGNQETVGGHPSGLTLEPFGGRPERPSTTDAADIPGATLPRPRVGSPATVAGLDLLALFSVATGGYDLQGKSLSPPATVGAVAANPADAPGWICGGIDAA